MIALLMAREEKEEHGTFKNGEKPDQDQNFNLPRPPLLY